MKLFTILFVINFVGLKNCFMTSHEVIFSSNRKLKNESLLLRLFLIYISDIHIFCLLCKFSRQVVPFFVGASVWWCGYGVFAVFESFFQECAGAHDFIELDDFGGGVEGAQSATDIEEVAGQAVFFV